MDIDIDIVCADGRDREDGGTKKAQSIVGRYTFVAVAAPEPEANTWCVAWPRTHCVGLIMLSMLS